MQNETPLMQETERLDAAIRRFEEQCAALGSYMPAIATWLRIHADDLAEKYPDEANGGSDAS